MLYFPVAVYIMCTTSSTLRSNRISLNSSFILQILDTASGESVFRGLPTTDKTSTEDATPTGAAVWAIAVRPDSKGFMTGGADQRVTFWDFVVSVCYMYMLLSVCVYMSCLHPILSR